MNILELNPTSGHILLYGESRYIALHDKAWVQCGIPAQDTDGVYAGRIILTLDDSTAKNMIYDWFQNGILDITNPEHAHRVPDSVTQRINIYSKHLNQ